MQRVNKLKLAIKRALLRLNEGEKISDFLEILRDECKTLGINAKNDDCFNTLQKALQLLKQNNIIDFDCNLPLDAINAKLSLLLQTQMQTLIETQTSQTSTLPFLNQQNAKKEILLCKISEKNLIKKLDSTTREKLLSTLCDLFIKHFNKKSIVGIYKDSIAIFPKIDANTSHKITIDTIKREILEILESNTFMLHNKPLKLAVEIVIKKCGELNE